MTDNQDDQVHEQTGTAASGAAGDETAPETAAAENGAETAPGELEADTPNRHASSSGSDDATGGVVVAVVHSSRNALVATLEKVDADAEDVILRHDMGAAPLIVLVTPQGPQLHAGRVSGWGVVEITEDRVRLRSSTAAQSAAEGVQARVTVLRPHSLAL